MKKVLGVINAEFTADGSGSLEITGPAPLVKAGLLSIIQHIGKIEGVTEKELIEEMLRVVKQREEIIAKIAKHKDLLDKMLKMKEYCDKTDCANCTVNHAQREKELEEIMEMLFGEKEEAN